MSNSKPVSPFVFDVLCYLNRDQLERFSIVCRSLKNIIERYFHSKPNRNFDELIIHGGRYALFHNGVQWHPNRDDYSAQQFLDGQSSRITCATGIKYYSFAEMHPYLGTSIRVKKIYIHVAPTVYSPVHIAEMESISYLWQDGNIFIRHADKIVKRIVAEDFLPILNSPTILQCRNLVMINANFSFKDYKMLYSVKVIEFKYIARDIDPKHWLDFLEQPGVKPVVALIDPQPADVDRAVVTTTLDSLSKMVRVAASHVQLGSNFTHSPKCAHIWVRASDPDHIAEMESISYLWQDGNISICHVDGYGKRIVAEDFLPILNSPTILQCRDLEMINANFSFKDYKILYSVKVIEFEYIARDIDPNHWLDFLEQPGVKPVVALIVPQPVDVDRALVTTTLNSLSKAFSSAVVPNGFKIVFAKYMTLPLTEFCETNKTSGEKLELKKGVPIEYQHRTTPWYGYYTLERSRI
ncbi:hypothetical protein DdX_21605 [Ditylenchus destructor]|uniref:F-box domain-containing protein n=1 Tax=Ditylenchus destructor TaxID=166010 RepID=A0AAD4QRB0_9BILA|nr:hypothetical protein DdX_21605 [Ditylenchus destructor]